MASCYGRSTDIRDLRESLCPIISLEILCFPLMYAWKLYYFTIFYLAIVRYCSTIPQVILNFKSCSLAKHAKNIFTEHIIQNRRMYIIFIWWIFIPRHMDGTKAHCRNSVSFYVSWVPCRKHSHKCMCKAGTFVS